MFSVCEYVNVLRSSNNTRLNLKSRKFCTVCFANDGTVRSVALFVSSSIQLCAFEYLRCNAGAWDWDVEPVLLLYVENEDKWVLLKGGATAAYCRDRIESSGKWEGKARWSINQFIDTNDCGFKVGSTGGLVKRPQWSPSLSLGCKNYSQQPQVNVLDVWTFRRCPYLTFLFPPPNPPAPSQEFTFVILFK